jgi:hypothetical protein
MELNKLVTYDNFVGVGAFLGFVSTFLNVKKEITKGPKITAKITEATLVKDSITVTKVEDGKQVAEYSGTLQVGIQFQNGGNELTSIVSCILTFPSGKRYYPKISRKAELVGGANDRINFASRVLFRVDDERVFAIQPGAVLLEKFQFDVTSENDFDKGVSGEVEFQFINHRKLSFDLNFENRKKLI